MEPAMVLNSLKYLNFANHLKMWNKLFDFSSILADNVNKEKNFIHCS
jgi:hypothetical protein